MVKFKGKWVKENKTVEQIFKVNQLNSQNDVRQ